MRLRDRKGLLWLAIALLIAIAGIAQEQQAPDHQAPPDASAPQAQNPQTETPQTTKPPAEPQPSSTPASQEQGMPPNPPAAQKAKRPATKQACANCKPGSSKTNTANKKKHKNQVTKSKAVPPQPGANSAVQPGKTVVRNGGTRDGAVELSAAGTQEQELHYRENTTQLLATTGQNLKSLAGRQLTASQQSTVDQIQSYVRQAKSATDSGDLDRAHTLALKAHLLSDDLAKR